MSVRLSVTCRYFIETAKHIKPFSPSGAHTILVIPQQTVWQYFDGDPQTEASNARGYEKNRDFRPIFRVISETIQDRAIVTMEGE